MSGAGSSQTPPPQAQLMQMAVGFTVPFLLRAAAQLCLADHLADGPKTSGQLAAMTGTHALALHRFLRTLASVAIVSQDESDRFSLTPLTEPLRSGVPGSVRTSILSITGDVFIVPWSKLVYSGSRRLLNDFVRAQQQRLWNRDAEVPGSLQVDNQLEPGCLLDGNIRGLRTLQDLVHVLRSAAVIPGGVISITEQSARDHVVAHRIYRRQPRELHQLLQLRALGEVHAVRRHHDSLRSLSNNLADRGAKLRGCTGDDAQRDKTQRGASALTLGPVSCVQRTACVQQDGNAPGARRDLVQNPDQLPKHLVLLACEARDVAPGLARLRTSPAPTALPTPARTMGTVFVARCAAAALWLLPTTITSTACPISWFASASKRSTSPLA